MSALYDAFEAVALVQGQELALVDDHGAHTYGELLALVQSLAQRLRAPQVHAIFITGPKCAATVAWQLAAAKAGQVFVPCDAATPVERLADMLQRTRPRWLVDAPENDHAARGYRFIEVFAGLALWESSHCAAWPAQLSHIIFSSGSTGTPKAIHLAAAPVVEVVQAQARAMALGVGGRFAWLLSPSFDASLSDVYSALLSGACLHVCSFSMRQVRTLRTYFQTRRITHTDLSPSLLPLLAPETLPHLQAVVFGGELAQEDCIHAWRRAGKRLFNAYGPTEATICTHWREATEGWQASNIGRPLPGVGCLLAVDANLTPAAPGLTGELWLNGTHLALGYDQDALTATRFVEREGVRHYRTGDLVRLDEQQDFHFVGRVDRQLKFHGVLLCPEETEAVARQAGCREAFLKLEHDKLVLHFAGDVAEATLRAALQARFVATVVPQRLVRHAELPKSLAGKVLA